MVVLSNPELLAQGTAIENLLQPDSVVIGCSEPEDETTKTAVAALKSLYSPWVLSKKILTMSHSSASLFKLANNALLAQRVSSVNSIALMCENLNSQNECRGELGERKLSLKNGTNSQNNGGASEKNGASKRGDEQVKITEADINDITRALNMNPRLSSPGSNYFQPGVGFGGSCLRKDSMQLADLAHSLGLSFAHRSFWDQTCTVNAEQVETFVNRVFTTLHSEDIELKNIIVGILGYAYKAGTGDARGTLTKAIVQRLTVDSKIKEVRIYEPHMTADRIEKDLTAVEEGGGDQCNGSGSPVNGQTRRNPPDSDRGNEGKNPIRICTSMTETCLGASILIVTTAEPEFIHGGVAARTHWSKIFTAMRPPRVVFDGRNCLDADTLAQIGFKVVQVGRGGKFSFLLHPHSLIENKSGERNGG